jgi:K+ transporter
LSAHDHDLRQIEWVTTGRIYNVVQFVDQRNQFVHISFVFGLVQLVWFGLLGLEGNTQTKKKREKEKAEEKGVQAFGEFD